MVAGWGVVVLGGCQSGIGSEPGRALATSRAYETRVLELERQIEDQEATVAALTPPPAAATPEPFAERWRVEIAGAVERRPSVGGDGTRAPLEARGEFVVVPIRVTNLGDSPAFFGAASTLALVDGEGTEYGLDGRASGAAYLLDFGLDASFSPRPPGVSYPDVLVFDVPPEARNLSLVALDGSFRLRLPRRPPATPEP